MESPPPAPRAQAALPVDDEPDYVDLDEDEDMTCPISYHLMHDPVKVLASGRIMDRSSIEMNFMRQLYYKQPLSCPMTCITVASMDDLQPLPKLQAYIRQHCVNTAQPPPKPCPGPFALLSDFLWSEDAEVQAKAAAHVMQHIQLGMTYEDANKLWSQATEQQYSVSEYTRMFALGAALVPTYLLLASKHQHRDDPLVFAASVKQLAELNHLPGLVQLLSCDSTELQSLAAEALALLAAAHGTRLAAAGVPAALVQLLRTSDDESVQRAAAKAVSQMMWKERGVIQQTVAAELRQHLDTEGASVSATQQQGTVRLVEGLLTHGRGSASLKAIARDLPMAPWLVHTLQASDSPDVLKRVLSLVLSWGAWEPSLKLHCVQAGVLRVLARVATVHDDLQQPVEEALESFCAASDDDQAVMGAVLDELQDPALRPAPGMVSTLPTQLRRAGCVGHLLRLLCCGNADMQAAAAEALAALCSTQGPALLKHKAPDTLLHVISSDANPVVQRAVATAVSRMLWQDTGAAGRVLKEHISAQLCTPANTETPAQLRATQLVACLARHGTQVAPVNRMLHDLGLGAWLVQVLHCATDDAVVLSALDLTAHLMADATLQQPLVDAGILPALCRAGSTSNRAHSVVVSLLNSMCAVTNSSVLQAVAEQLSDGLLIPLLPGLPKQLARRGCGRQLLQFLGHPEGQLQTAAAQAMAELDHATLARWQVIPALLQQLLVTEHAAVQQVLVGALCRLAESLKGEVKQAVIAELSKALQLMGSANSEMQLSGLAVVGRLVPCCQGALSLPTLVTDMRVVGALMSLLGRVCDVTVLQHALQLLSVLSQYESVQLQLVQAGVLPLATTGAHDLGSYGAAQQALQDINLDLLRIGSPDHQLTVLHALHSLMGDGTSQHSSRSTLVLGCDLVAQLVSLLHDSAEPAVLHAALSVLAAMAQSYHVQAALLHAGVLPVLSHCASASSVVYDAAHAVAKELQDSPYIQVGGVITSPLAASYAEHLLTGVQLPELLQLLAHPDPRAQEAAVSAITRAGAHTAAALIDTDVVPALLQLLGRSADVSVQSAVGAALCRWGWQEQGPLREHTRLHTRWALANLRASDQHKHLPAIRVLSRLSAHSQQIVPLHILLTDLHAIPDLLSVFQYSSDTEALQEALALLTQLAACPELKWPLVQAGLCEALLLVVARHSQLFTLAAQVQQALLTPQAGGLWILHWCRRSTVQGAQGNGERW